MAIFKPFITQSGIDVKTYRITNLGDPSDSTDATTNRYARNASNINSGVLSINYGGTGATTQPGALRQILPPQDSNTAGKVLASDGTDAAWQSTFSGSYNDLTNKPTYAQVAYSGLLGDLGNVDLAGLQDGQVLAYDATLSIWKAIFPPAALTTVASMTDVDVTGAQQGSVMAYNTVTQKWTATNTLSDITIDGGDYPI